MCSTSTQLVGRPVYPRSIRKPTALWERIAGDSATRELYEKLITARNDSQQRRVAVEELLARESSPTRVIDMSMLASQAFSARQLKDAIAVLNDQEITELSAEIEKRARILFDALLAGDTRVVSATTLAHAGAISNEVMIILAKNIPDVIQYLKIAELTDRELITKLRDEPAFHEGFVTERKKYQNAPEIDRLKAELLAEIKLLSEHLSPLRKHELFWSPHDLLRNRLTDKTAQQYLRRQCEPTWEVERFLTHDIGHTFAKGVIDGYVLDRSARYHLGMYLLGFCHLSLHLEHFKYVLAVNNFRLAGELPPIENIPVARMVEAAAHAAGFRWRLPINISGEAKAGYINCFVEEGIGKAIHPAFLDIIIYNLIKNSIKAEIEDANKEDGDIRIVVSMKRDKNISDAVIISVEDSAQGFNLEKLLAAARDLLEKPENKGIAASFPALEKVRRWQEAPFTIRSFSVGKLFDLAFVAKITGFSERSISSGLGLFEIAEVAQLLGADVMMTNKYQGGARIDLILGSEPEREQIIGRELGY